MWASLGGKGKVGSSRVFRLKLWWDHMGTGSVRSRGLQAKLTRAEVRVAAEHEDTAVADGERVEMLRKALAASQKCGQCGAAVRVPEPARRWSGCGAVWRGICGSRRACG